MSEIWETYYHTIETISPPLLGRASVIIHAPRVVIRTMEGILQRVATTVVHLESNLRVNRIIIIIPQQCYLRKLIDTHIDIYRGVKTERICWEGSLVNEMK